MLLQASGATNEQLMYSLGRDSYVIRASNMKFLITTAALQKLNLNSRIHSTLAANWIKITNLTDNNAYANVSSSYL